jgi:hypothetical protein
MLKMFAKGTKGDGASVRLVVLGLSHGNLDELRKGRPIKFSGDTVRLDPDIKFIIMAGETEQSMQREFAKFIGPETEVKIDPRLRD